ncbi:MAG: putative oxidoreductase C-terminal domain-containing protein [Chitinophagaceae bacterium]
MNAPIFRILSFLGITALISCNNNPETVADTPSSKKVQLITLDPGHFHAALVQKAMYNDVDSVVHVYAPEGSDLQAHLGRINSYNTRADNPTHWKEEVYSGDDFFEKMIAEKKGNVVVLSGNNRKKAEYILKSLQNGFNVFADKPMVVKSEDFGVLKQAFETAQKNKLLLYDIMTERYEIATILQRELSMMPEVFGELEKGTTANPAVTMISIHNFYKYVSGSVVTRPAWFLDVTQQGEGITDVMTHIVDLVQWECFPEQSLDYTKDINVETAKRWTTDIRLSQFRAITKLDSFPSFLKKNVSADSILKVSCNGEINYTVKGVHAKTSVIWEYQLPNGSGDTHYSMMRGTKANLVIRQGAEEKYIPTLYIEPTGKDTAFARVLAGKIEALSSKYNSVKLSKTANGWQVVISENLREGHESHFARVTEKFLEYLKNGNIPAWEVPNMIAKYYTTTKALEIALKK